MKKLLLAGTTVLLMATSASAQSSGRGMGFYGGGGLSQQNLCSWYGGVHCGQRLNPRYRVCKPSGGPAWCYRRARR
jgi:hypothetical protein